MSTVYEFTNLRIYSILILLILLGTGLGGLKVVWEVACFDCLIDLTPLTSDPHNAWHTLLTRIRESFQVEHVVTACSKDKESRQMWKARPKLYQTSFYQ